MTTTIKRRKPILALALTVIVLVVLWFVYSPEHWLRRVNLVTVKVDDRVVPASVYIGNPTNSEAEAVSLIHVPRVGSYLFSFDGEKYREASNREFIRLPFGAWTFKSMVNGRFAEPLPSRSLNELRILSNGHIVIVQF
jgi:hypothetical protein